MDTYEQIKTLKALAADLTTSRIGCGELVLVDTAILETLCELVEQLPITPPAELRQAYDNYALFCQVQDALEVEV